MTTGTDRTVPATCDLLIIHGYLLTMDAQRTVYPDGAIAITGNRIVAVGPSTAIEAAWTSARRIDAGGGTVHPGFIDGHYHAGMHLSRGSITDNPNPPKEEGGAGPGVFTRWMNAVDDEDEYASALMASAEMVRNGFTGFVDAATSYSQDAIVEGAQAVGIRCSVSDCMLWDIVGGEPMAADIPRAPCDARRAREGLGNQLKRNKEDGLARGHVALYGLGSASEELMQEAKALSDSSGAVFHQHQNFMVADASYDKKRFGKPALVHFAEKNLIGPDCFFTHMNILEQSEVEAVSASGMGLIWHPGNFMYYGISRTGRSRFPELHRAGTSVALGTDIAKTWVFGDLGFIAYLVSREWGDYLPSQSILEMFTLGGARAFGLPSQLGSIEVGKKADVVVRSSDLPDAQPNVDVVRQLVLVSRTKAVDTVVCNGEIIVRHGRLVKLDESEIYKLARQSAERVAKRAGIVQRSVWPIVG
jgi:cytosine/adenosine deaminase-related metal-dependent hydrolase